jgi:hypothetical protein
MRRCVQSDVFDENGQGAIIVSAGLDEAAIAP